MPEATMEVGETHWTIACGAMRSAYCALSGSMKILCFFGIIITC